MPVYSPFKSYACGMLRFVFPFAIGYSFFFSCVRSFDSFRYSCFFAFDEQKKKCISWWEEPKMCAKHKTTDKICCLHASYCCFSGGGGRFWMCDPQVIGFHDYNWSKKKATIFLKSRNYWNIMLIGITSRTFRVLLSISISGSSLWRF